MARKTNKATATEEQAPVVDQTITEDDLAAIETAEAQAAAYADQDANQATAAEQGPAVVEAQAPPVDFKDALEAVSETEVQTLMAALTTEFAERARFEHDANPNNTNIQKTLTKLIGRFSKPMAARALVVTGTGAGPVNTSEVTGKRRNVYALDKMADILYGAATGHLKNAVNLAVVTSMVKLNGAGVPFTGVVAKACASDKIAVSNQLKALLVRHTMAEGTASTQASSTMTALEDLGVVANSGTRQHPIFEMIDTPLTRRLVEITAAGHGQVAAPA